MLAKQLIPLVFSKGVQTGTDPKVSTDLQQLENGRLDRVGAITKRTGTKTNTNAGYTEPFITKHKDRPLLIGQGSVRTFDGAARAATGNFDQIDTTIGFCDVEASPVASGARAYYACPDVIVYGNIMVVVYTDYQYTGINSTPYLPRIVTFDKTTGQQLDSQDLTANSIKTYARLAQGATEVYVWFLDGTRVKFYTVDATGTISGSATDPSGGLPNALAAGRVAIDCCELDDANRTMLVTYLDANNDVTTFAYSTTSGFVSSDTVTGTFLRCACYKHATNAGMVVYSAGVGSVTAKAFNAAMAVIGTAATIDTTPSPHSCTTVAGCAFGAGTSRCYLTLEDLSPTSRDPEVRYVTLSLAGGAVTPTAPTTLTARCRLASDPFGSLGSPYVMVHFRAQPNSGGDDDVAVAAQSMYFIIDPSGRVVGKVFPGRGGPIDDDAPVNAACSVMAWSTSYMTLGLMWTSRSISPALQTKLRTLAAVDSVMVQRLIISTGAPSSLRTVEANGLVHIPNSNPYFFDGQDIVEQGFLVYPEGVILTASNTASGVLTSLVPYGYCATYEWTDAQGNVHRSCPSPISVLTLTPGGSYDTITIQVPPLPASLTRKTGVRCVLYRTDESGAILYRLASAPADTTPAGIGQWVTFTDYGEDTASGVTLTVSSESPLGRSYSSSHSPATYISQSGNPWLYTTGGTLENAQPPAHRVQCIHQGRLFLVDRENEKTVVRYSRWLLEGEGPGLNDTFQITVPEDGGAITALESFQDRLVIFKADRIYACHGNGLAENATGQDYSAPLLLATGYGCKTQKSLATIPPGLAFQASSGDLILLKQDFTIDADFGQPVQYHTDSLTISAAAVIPELQHAIWTTTTGLALVFGYHMGQWSTFTNHEASDAVECNGLLHLHYSTYVRIEDRTVYLDDAASISMKLVTGWIPINGMGYGRLYSINLLGQNIAPHKLICWPRYDLDPVWNTGDKVTFNANTLGSAFDVASYHSSAGLAATYADKGYELSAGTTRQKMERIQIAIYDESHDGVTATNEGYSITQLGLLVGIRDAWLPRYPAREMS